MITTRKRMHEGDAPITDVVEDTSPVSFSTDLKKLHQLKRTEKMIFRFPINRKYGDVEYDFAVHFSTIPKYASWYDDIYMVFSVPLPLGYINSGKLGGRNFLVELELSLKGKEYQALKHSSMLKFEDIDNDLYIRSFYASKIYEKEDNGHNTLIKGMGHMLLCFMIRFLVLNKLAAPRSIVTLNADAVHEDDDNYYAGYVGSWKLISYYEQIGFTQSDKNQTYQPMMHATCEELLKACELKNK